MSITKPTKFELQKLANHYVLSGRKCQSDSFRAVFNSKGSAKTINQHASRIFNTPTLHQLIEDLCSQHLSTAQAKGAYSIESQLAKLEAAMADAKNNHQSGAVIAGLREQNRILGHDGVDANRNVPKYDSAIEKDEDNVVQLVKKPA